METKRWAVALNSTIRSPLSVHVITACSWKEALTIAHNERWSSRKSGKWQGADWLPDDLEEAREAFGQLFDVKEID